VSPGTRAIRTGNPDGGVEWYPPPWTEWGWQAKHVKGIDALLTAMTESVKRVAKENIGGRRQRRRARVGTSGWRRNSAARCYRCAHVTSLRTITHGDRHFRHNHGGGGQHGGSGTRDPTSFLGSCLLSPSEWKATSRLTSRTGGRSRRRRQARHAGTIGACFASRRAGASAVPATRYSRSRATVTRTMESGGVSQVPARLCPLPGRR
jgi:hypothetical protein